jgi:hypothetical protein
MDTKTTEDPKTDGKGSAAVVDTADKDAAGQGGSDTPADKGEGQGDAVVTPADEDTDDTEEGEGEGEGEEGDEGKPQFTQAQLDSKIKSRLAKQKKTLETAHAAKVTELEAQIATLTGERDTFRSDVVASVKAEFEALPEEIRAAQTADINTPEGFKAIRDWLPTGKSLADKLATAAKVPGNGDDPNPAGLGGETTTDEELVKQAKSHSLYTNF